MTCSCSPCRGISITLAKTKRHILHDLICGKLGCAVHSRTPRGQIRTLKRRARVTESFAFNFRGLVKRKLSEPCAGRPISRLFCEQWVPQASSCCSARFALVLSRGFFRGFQQRRFIVPVK